MHHAENRENVDPHFRRRQRNAVRQCHALTARPKPRPGNQQRHKIQHGEATAESEAGASQRRKTAVATDAARTAGLYFMCAGVTFRQVKIGERQNHVCVVLEGLEKSCVPLTSLYFPRSPSSRHRFPRTPLSRRRDKQT